MRRKEQDEEEQASPWLLVALLRPNKVVDNRLIWVASWGIFGGLSGPFGRHCSRFANPHQPILKQPL